MLENKVDFIEMTIPALSEYVGIARLTSSGIANHMGFSYDDIEDIKIAISEACTNVVNHAYKQSEQGKITLRIGVFEDRLEMMVADNGHSFDYDNVIKELKPIDGNKPLDQMNEGGLGLFLIETLMDKVDISGESGVVVMMTKFLSRDEVELNADKVSATTDR